MARTNPARLEKILNEALQKLQNRKDVEHVVLAVETGNRSFRWVGTSGVTSPEGAPMTEQTPYFIASVTKLYISASVLKLCEQQMIEPDEPITSYLPESFTDRLHVLNGTDYSRQITVRHLLSHSSGLPDWLEDRPKKGKSFFEELEEQHDRYISLEEAIDNTRRHLTPHFPPQDLNVKKPSIRYSDTNFQLLIAILEHQTGQPVHRVFADLIYEPLGLKNTWHAGHQPEQSPAAPAVPRAGSLSFAQPELMRSFRDLYSTADDQLRFMRGLMQGELFQKNQTLLEMQQWNRFGFPRDLAALRQPGWPIQYGFGMMRFQMPRLFTPFRPVPPLVGHTGATGSWLFYCADLDLYLCGTVDQLTEAPLPFRFLPGLIQKIGEV